MIPAKLVLGCQSRSYAKVVPAKLVLARVVLHAKVVPAKLVLIAECPIKERIIKEGAGVITLYQSYCSIQFN